jgi:hypothetical protein
LENDELIDMSILDEDLKVSSQAKSNKSMDILDQVAQIIHLEDSIHEQLEINKVIDDIEDPE